MTHENPAFSCPAPSAAYDVPPTEYEHRPDGRVCAPTNMASTSPLFAEVRAYKINVYRALARAALTPAISAYWSGLLDAEAGGRES